MWDTRYLNQEERHTANVNAFQKKLDEHDKDF